MLPKSTADTARKWGLFSLNECSLIQHPKPANGKISMALSEVLGWGSGTAGAPRGAGLGQRVPSREGTEGGEGPGSGGSVCSPTRAS